jgi:hypothetical protein
VRKRSDESLETSQRKERKKKRKKQSLAGLKELIFIRKRSHGWPTFYYSSFWETNYYGKREDEQEIKTSNHSSRFRYYHKEENESRNRMPFEY